MKPQRCYGGVRYLGGTGPSLKNIAELDAGAIPMILHMAQRGLQVDLSHFARMHTVLTTDMDRITEEVRTLTGQYTNLDSGPQVSHLLFKTLGLKQARLKLTNSGDREAVDDEVLVAIQHDHPVVPLILEYKELSKLDGTYVKPMPKLARRTAFGQWRMFPNFNTTRIPSGRLACKEPNLLAMPNRTERGREVCEGFITDPGWVYLSVDESQIEPRVVAHRSGDNALRGVYENQEDIYSDFAIAAFKIKDERYRDQTGEWKYPGVDKKSQRFPAKTCILASIYDVTAKGLLEQMPTVCRNCHKEATLHDCDHFQPFWDEPKCQALIDSFYKKYPGILTMRRQDHQRALKHGFLWDDWGRILHVQAVYSKLKWVVSSALREAGNFPIQSTAQGTVKLTMAAVHDDMLESSMHDVAHPLLQIHDELLFECREDVAEELAAHAAYRFETCVRLDIPIKSSSAQAVCWGKLPK